MDLTHPERLLLLLLVPLLWWLARPPRPRFARITAHLVQWRQALARLRRRPVRFRKLRFWLLVIALVAIAGASTGARAGGRSGPRELAALLDATASTGASEPDGGTAFALERALLKARLQALPRGIAARVLVVGARMSVLELGEQGFDAALDALDPGGASAVDVAALAARLDGPDSVVWTLTDGRDGVPERGALTVVGTAELSNAGFTGCQVRDAWPLPDVRVRLTVAGTAEFSVEVTGGAEAAGPVAIDADAPGSAELVLRRTTGGSVTLRLRHAGPDALAADDTLHLVLAPPPAPDIAVLSAPGGGRWAARAAEALAELSGGRVTDAATTAGFVLADGGVIRTPPRRALTFGTAVTDAPTWQPGGVPRDWNRTDPLTRRLDFSELRVASVLAPASLSAGGVPLIVGPDGPWLVAVDHDGRRSIHAAFRLDDSNLPLLPAFPQLLRRAFAWCYGAGARAAFDPSSLPGAAESDLRRIPATTADRPLPAFGDDGVSLTIPLLALAFALLAGRLYA